MRIIQSRSQLQTLEAILLFSGLVCILVLAQIPAPLVKGSPAVIRVPQDFATIQEAIAFASPGDTIVVDSGEYFENLVIGKSISLTGVSPDTTIIDASGLGPGIKVVRTVSVTISGFTVKNTGSFYGGIVIDSSSSISLIRNDVRASSDVEGVYVYNSNSSVMKANILTENLVGITIQGGFGNLIQENNITGNSASAVEVFSSAGNTIVDNVLRKSDNGLDLSAVSGSMIARNLVANNSGTGISIENSTSNLLVENLVEFNSGTGFLAGIWMRNAAGNRFYHNNIRNNTACCPLVSAQVFSSTPGDLASNIWDNATRTLGSDPSVTFVDTNDNGVWNYNETVVYDRDKDNLYYSGDLLIAYAKGTVLGAGTVLRTNSHIRFADTDSNNSWNLGEQVVYDSNDNGKFDQGEPGLAGVGGNYWSDYQGLDDGSNGYAGDGVGDTLTPHPCPAGGRPCSLTGPLGVDWYPLTSSWQSIGLSVTVSATPLGGTAQLLVSFAGSVVGGIPPYTFAWNFGDGVTAGNSTNVSHTYQGKGNYFATLRVTDRVNTTGSGTAPVTVFAPVGSLVLRVLDETLQPIRGANVTSLAQPPGEARLGQIANDQGIVAWANLTPGAYLIQASSLGYESARKNVTVVEGQTGNEQIVLTRAGQPGGEVPLNLPLVVGVGAGLAAAGIGGIFFMRRLKKRVRAGAVVPSRVLIYGGC